MNIVIAGFGVAGATAAETARKTNPKAYITVFSQEKDLFYYRPRLPEVVSGAVPLEKIIAHPQSWYQDQRLEVRLGEKVVDIEPENRLVRGSTGSRLNYDQLLLATGAESNRPPFEGDALAGVFAVRSLKDAWELYSHAKGQREAVLIGGGLLGLEMAYALTKHGLTVTVLERAERILPRQTTPESAALLEKRLAALGIKFLLGGQARRFEGQGRVEQVALTSGAVLPADLVLISAGITPNLELAKHLDLKIDRAIVVDQHLETSRPGIYAAGDCAQAENCLGGLWTVSRLQGLTAGHNLAAAPEERRVFVPEPPSNTLKVAGIDLVAAGDLDPEGRLPQAVAQTENTYRKVVTGEDGRMVGFTNLGATRGNREMAAALLAKKPISPETLKALEDPEFDFNKI